MESFDVASFATWLVAFLFSTTCHEAAHAVVGRWGGDRTAEKQATLNPLPHLRREPIGMVALPLATGGLSHGSPRIGWASAPYDPEWARRRPGWAALMSAAGPAANVVLAALCIAALRLLRGASIPYAAAYLLLVGACLNALLFVFNLIPLPPLAGAGAVRGLGGPLAAALDGLRRSPFASIAAFFAAFMLFQWVAPHVVNVVVALVVGGAR